MRPIPPFKVALSALLLAALLPFSAVQAQSVGDFYKGKNINFVVGYPPAASNDIYARALARNLGKHIPGNPTIVLRHMPGGGSLVAANHIYNVAPKDGTMIGLVAPTMPLEALLGAANARFDPLKFNWIGRISPTPTATYLWHTSPVKTVHDAFSKEVLLGATARSSALSIYPNVLSNVAGLKFKLVMGYKGLAEAMLAMERGEVDGASGGWDGLKATHPDWIKDRKVRVIVQYTLRRHADLPDVPTGAELGRNPEEVQILRIVTSATELGKIIVSTPDTPADRIAALRADSMRP